MNKPDYATVVVDSAALETSLKDALRQAKESDLISADELAEILVRVLVKAVDSAVNDNLDVIWDNLDGRVEQINTTLTEVASAAAPEKVTAVEELAAKLQEFAFLVNKGLAEQAGLQQPQVLEP